MLLIEDETSIAELEREHLEVAGFELRPTSVGDTGLSFLRTEQFDLVILYIVLAVLCRFEVRIRSS